jgi:hypothetical protein
MNGQSPSSEAKQEDIQCRSGCGSGYNFAPAVFPGLPAKLPVAKNYRDVARQSTRWRGTLEAGK